MHANQLQIIPRRARGHEILHKYCIDSSISTHSFLQSKSGLRKKTVGRPFMGRLTFTFIHHSPLTIRRRRKRRWYMRMDFHGRNGMLLMWMCVWYSRVDEWNSSHWRWEYVGDHHVCGAGLVDLWKLVKWRDLSRKNEREKERKPQEVKEGGEEREEWKIIIPR